MNMLDPGMIAALINSPRDLPNGGPRVVVSKDYDYAGVRIGPVRDQPPDHTDGATL